MTYSLKENSTNFTANVLKNNQLDLKFLRKIIFFN